MYYNARILQIFHPALHFIKSVTCSILLWQSKYFWFRFNLDLIFWGFESVFQTFLADQITNKIKLLIDQIILVYLIQIKWEIVLNIFVRFIFHMHSLAVSLSYFLIFIVTLIINLKLSDFFIKGQRKCNTSGNTVAHNYIYTH